MTSAFGELKVTGWPDVYEQGVIVGGLAIKTPWRPGETPQRVTATAYPRTDQHGLIRQLTADPRQVRPAKRPKGTQWRVVGHLQQVCRSTGRIKIESFRRPCGFHGSCFTLTPPAPS